MAKSQETFSKKEKEKIKIKKRQEKEEKKAQRKANSSKGLGIEHMMAYVDENGNLTSVPPDPRKRLEIKAEDIAVSVSRKVEEPEEKVKTGTVSFFNEEKGYGFIKETKTKEGIFVHSSNLLMPVKEGNLVSFEVETNQKGPYATNVKLTQ